MILVFRSSHIYIYMYTRVDLQNLVLRFHTPKRLLIQFHKSNLWKAAYHKLFVQFHKIIEKRFELVSAAIWTKPNNLVMKKTMFLFFLEKNGYHRTSIYEKCMTSIFLIATTKNFPSKYEVAPNFVLFFFHRKSNFVFKQTFSKLVQDTNKMGLFYCFSGWIVSNRLKIFNLLCLYMPWSVSINLII